ncbi:MAG TPA: flagellar biosynthesis protein FlhB [Chromatiaceae bacterium]|jgi:flagellar biosynthetic protein FlhB|nr:flagellar biosynthesis protein FlhB [Chromatiaceae bacterium]HIB85102.1 flagellar biosynthesis protein FlhB [Chromatiaceae bacterium]HIO14950.1 flagellar biosynthesis protein FlhB [Chromatiales bacterium]
MAQETGQEKTEQPTPKRLADSAKKGQVARSRELTTAIVMITAASAVFLIGGDIVSGLHQIMVNGFTISREQAFRVDLAMPHMAMMVMSGFMLIVPFAVMLSAAAFFAPMALGGFVFSMQSVAPKFDKLNPVKGLGRIFAARGLIELIKALLKFSLVGAIVVGLLWQYSDTFLGLGNSTLENGVSDMAGILQWGFLLLSSALLLIAAIDAPFQLWDHHKKLRMTLQEVKDESKETDGRPEVKSRIRQLQRELSQGRMMDAVPQADVVVINPTHYAVALKYDRDGNGAPVVVAKGADLVAAHIRSLAIGNDVPLFQAPPLARALYANVDIDEEIPSGLFLAVAQVLAYVFQANDVMRFGGVMPERPEYFDIPKEYVTP